MSAIKKIEETYLKLFKIVLLLILTVSLFAAIGLAIKGWFDSNAEPVRVAPVQTAPPPEVNFESFIKSLEATDQPTPEPVPAAPSAPSAPQASQINPLDEMVDKSIESTWPIYNAFQTGCLIEQPDTKQEFLNWEGLRDFYRANFETLGQPFAASQDGFIRLVYADPRVVQLCIKRGGDDGIFAQGLEWHQAQWTAAVDAIETFDFEERSREQDAMTQARIEAAGTRASGTQMLWAALVAFGVFMSLALLLIFSKIESNLRPRQDET